MTAFLINVQFLGLLWIEIVDILLIECKLDIQTGLTAGGRFGVKL